MQAEEGPDLWPSPVTRPPFVMSHTTGAYTSILAPAASVGRGHGRCEHALPSEALQHDQPLPPPCEPCRLIFLESFAAGDLRHDRGLSAGSPVGRRLSTPTLPAAGRSQGEEMPCQSAGSVLNAMGSSLSELIFFVEEQDTSSDIGVATIERGIGQGDNVEARVGHLRRVLSCSVRLGSGPARLGLRVRCWWVGSVRDLHLGRPRAILVSRLLLRILGFGEVV